MQRPALRAYLRDFERHFTATKTHYFFIDKRLCPAQLGGGAGS
jgi:hypothetical protein